MESRFGYDFSDVRVHTDQLAARSAEVVAAQAYTVGSHMVFGVGRYAPASRDGQRLLAHELAHVVQQSARDLSHALPADGRTDVLRHTLHDETHRGTAGNVAGVLRVARQPKTPPTKTPPKTVFHPGVMHNHKPSGRWAEVQAAPNSDRVESFVCQNGDPAAVMTAGVLWKLRDKWIASDHIRWFFKDGGGADYVEDSNLESMLRSDAKIQAVLRALIPKDRSSGTFVSRVEIRQDDYDDEDFRFAFGAIDRLDFEANFDAGTLHVWFQDRYEWHPVYPKLYAQLPGDKVRSDNCVHAAAVELKSGKARDYWMKGEATIPLTALQSAAYRWTPPEAIL